VSCRLLVTGSTYSDAALVVQAIADVIEAQQGAAAGLEVTPGGDHVVVTALLHELFQVVVSSHVLALVDGTHRCSE
jgi:hypothetical protein